MQLSRLFEITYLLLERKNITAKELAERFEVSTRTIYRDLEALSQAGVPIYACRGKNGGIRLMDDFILNKSVLSEKEKQQILTSLHGMNALQVEEVQPVLSRLAALFGAEHEDWIRIDFTAWNPQNPVSERFEQLKQAIFSNRVVTFRYCGMNGKISRRLVEPVRLIFKGYDWYLQGYCRSREDFRFFKLNRMEALSVTGEAFVKKIPPEREAGQPMVRQNIRKITVKIMGNMAYRVYDEFTESMWEKNPDGSFTVRFEMEENRWLLEYLLGYGENLVVMEPKDIREKLGKTLEEMLKNYKI